MLQFIRMHCPDYIIFFDASCRICQRSRRMIERLKDDRPMIFVDMNDLAKMAEWHQLGIAANRGQIWVRNPAGELAGGFDGLLLLLPALPLLRPLGPLLRLAPIRVAGRAVYRWIARNRYRLGGQVSCEADACHVHA